MAWPQNTEYNEAIQSPGLCFQDPELKLGTPELDRLGLPRARSGNFADVYRLTCPRHTWAIKCFTREQQGLQERYRLLHEYLEQAPLPFMVDFVYLSQGIRVRGQWFPILKMSWVEGSTLNEFVHSQLEQPHYLLRLAQMWLRLAQQLRKAQLAHCDLQHGNVLLVPGSKLAALSLRLIDYDGMWAPPLRDRHSGELGHPHFQHPERVWTSAYHQELDRFSHLVIYTALRALALGGRPLWDRYDCGENLLFREIDFQQPEQSDLYRTLLLLNDPALSTLVGHLILASQGTLTQVPLLDEVVSADGQPRELTPEQAKLLQRHLPGLPLRHTATVLTASRAAPQEPLAPPPAEGMLPLVLIPASAIRLVIDDKADGGEPLRRWLQRSAYAAAVFVLTALLLILVRLVLREPPAAS